MGVNLKVLHKVYNFERKVTEVDSFFVHFKTVANEIITVTNSHFFNNSFLVSLNKEQSKEPII